MRYISSILLFAICVTTFTSCFTGVESTAKITEKELKKQKIVDSPEKHVMDSVILGKPSTWKAGKRFYIADNRASRGMWSIEPVSASDNLNDKIAVIEKIDTINSLTGSREVTILMTIVDDNVAMEFRTGLSPEQWNSIETFSLPHMIDLDLVDLASDVLKGKKLYIIPSRRSGFDRADTLGTKYQAVTVVDVCPETESAPLRVFFTDDEGHLSSVIMTVGGGAVAARRNFETIFSLSDPRPRYKNISDSTWDLIIHSKLKEGMTTEEARLALGAPDGYKQIPTHGGLVEQWSYMNGVYLVFEDGVLTRFRQ